VIAKKAFSLKPMQVGLLLPVAPYCRQSVERSKFVELLLVTIRQKICKLAKVVCQLWL